MELKNKLAAALKGKKRTNKSLKKFWKVSKGAILKDGIAYTVNKRAKIVNNEVYTYTPGAYKDPTSKNIYRVVKNAIVNKKGNIYTRSRHFSYLKENGKYRKVHAFVKDNAAFKNKNGNIYKLAKKALVTKSGNIYTPNTKSFIGMGGVVYTLNSKAHIVGGIVYLKRPKHKLLTKEGIKKQMVKAKKQNKMLKKL